MVRRAPLDLTARAPGTFTRPTSSAHRCYNDDEKAWSGGIELSIARP